MKKGKVHRYIETSKVFAKTIQTSFKEILSFTIIFDNTTLMVHDFTHYNNFIKHCMSQYFLVETRVAILWSQNFDLKKMADRVSS